MRMNNARDKPDSDVDDNSNISAVSPPKPNHVPRSPNCSQNDSPRNGVPINRMKFQPPGMNPQPARAPREDTVRGTRFNHLQQRVQDNADGQWDNKTQDKPFVPPQVEKKVFPPRQVFERPKTKYDIPRANFGASKAYYDASKANYDASKANYDASKANYDASKANYDAPKTNYDTSKANYDAPKTNYDAPKANYDASKANYDASKANYDATKANYDASKANYDASKTNYDASKANYDASKASYDAPKTNNDAPKTNNDASETNYGAPKTNFAYAKAKVDMKMLDTPKPKIEVPEVEETVKPVKALGVSVTTETRVKPKAPEIPLVPAQYMVEKLPIGEAFILSVERAAASCGSKQAGFVCLAMHADYEEQYTMLLGDIYDGETSIVPKPGATFAYFNPEDEGWYRARCLNPTQCALLDASRVADIPAGQCRQLAASFVNIPEFCCVLNGNIEVGMSLKCTIMMKSGAEYKVSLDNADCYLGEGSVTRWLPRVETQSKQEENPEPYNSSRSQNIKPEPVAPKQETSAPKLTPQKLPQTQVEESVPEPLEAHENVSRVQNNMQRAQENVSRVQNNVQRAQENVSGVQRVQESVQKPKSPPKLPSIDRPDIINNGRYILLHVTSLSLACVRASDDDTTNEFESVLQDVAAYGVQSGKRLTEPPVAGDVVLCHYEGVHYRALVIRTKAADNKFKVQYAEYGNEEIVTLDKLFACPPELDLASRPPRATLLSLSASVREITEEAAEYLDSLKEEVELVANIPTGEKTAPSGSLVIFSVAQNKENVNKKLELMCTPDWKKLEAAGGDVIDSDVVLISDVATLPLPTSRAFSLHVTDVSSIRCGVISGYEEGASLASIVYGPLTQKINEYCNSSLCKEPYLPAVEEVCLAKMDGQSQWYRAVVLSHTAGAATASVLYLDNGRVINDVPVTYLRKCMREFVKQPALAALIFINDWPETATEEQVQRALQYLQVDAAGTGKLLVSSCQLTEEETYTIVHEELLAAVNTV